MIAGRGIPVLRGSTTSVFHKIYPFTGIFFVFKDLTNLTKGGQPIEISICILTILGLMKNRRDKS